MIFVIKTDDEVSGLDVATALNNAGVAHTIKSKNQDEAAQPGVQADGAMPCPKCGVDNFQVRCDGCGNTFTPRR